MSLRKQLLPILNSNKEKIESELDASKCQIWGVQKLKHYLKSAETTRFLLENVALSPDDLILYLTKNSNLVKAVFRTSRAETLYLWRTVSHYQLLPTLRPKGYYSHKTAMYLHGLTGHEPNDMYFNVEQHARGSTGQLEQSRIDNAFKTKQRVTTAVTHFQNRSYWLLNGRQTGNLGVIMLTESSAVEVPVTSIERTLIDITVRPAYAGGVNAVLQAFRLARSRVSVARLVEALRILDYVYPYYQSIGFYIDMAGGYSVEDCQQLLAYGPLKYDFYLDYGMETTGYSPKWRMYYPVDIIV